MDTMEQARQEWGTAGRPAANSRTCPLPNGRFSRYGRITIDFERPRKDLLSQYNSGGRKLATFGARPR